MDLAAALPAAAAQVVSGNIMKKLTQEEIQTELQKIVEWDVQGQAISKIFTFNNFKEALVFMNKVGEIAEALQHHPDIDIRYDKVTITLSTHDIGGLSFLDFKSAQKYDSLM